MKKFQNCFLPKSHKFYHIYLPFLKIQFMIVLSKLFLRIQNLSEVFSLKKTILMLKKILLIVISNPVKLNNQFFSQMTKIDKII